MLTKARSNLLLVLILHMRTEGHFDYLKVLVIAKFLARIGN
jgi:hypothetical protein